MFEMIPRLGIVTVLYCCEFVLQIHGYESFKTIVYY